MINDAFLKNILKRVPSSTVRKLFRKVYWHMVGSDPLPFFRETGRNALRLAPVCDGPPVSILCSVWNTHPGLLRQMIHSIRKQSYQNWELVVNNCSDPSHPETDRILSFFAEADPRIKVCKTVNQGIALNTNAAADRAAGDFILLMDHDDMLLPDALELLMKAQKAEDADFVYSDEYYLQMQYHVVWRRHKNAFSMKTLESVNYINHPALIRKTLFSQIGGFRTGFDGSQDYDLYLRLFEKTSRIAYVPKALYVWRIHQNSFSQSSIQKCIDSGKRALEEHFSRLGVPALVDNYKNETRFKVRLLEK